MNKELFIKCIAQLKSHGEKVDKICDLLDELGDEHTYFYPFSSDDELILDVLRDQYGEDIVENDVCYFCYELEFGKNWEPGAVTENGEDVKMATIEDLYKVCEKGLKKGE